MAEQDVHQHTADVKEGETLSNNAGHVSESEKHKQEEADKALNANNTDLGSSLASTVGKTENDNGKDMEQADSEKNDSPEEATFTEGCSSSKEVKELTVEDESIPPQAVDGGRGDNIRPTPSNEQLTIKEEYHTGENEALKTTTSTSLSEKEEDLVDGPNVELKEEPRGAENKEPEAEEDDESSLGIQECTTSSQTALPDEILDKEEIDTERKNIETVHSTTQETSESTPPPVDGGSGKYLIAVAVVVIVAILVQQLLKPETPPQKDDVRQIDIFLRQMDKLKTQFPNQRAELWSRSKIHLLRHLQTAQPTEPVSLILTAGVRAERTMQCLAQGLASAFSSTLNASVLQIDGASIANQDSDQVKLDIDSKLQGAFEGDKPVAVIHRFEELPPGSTLIFYRYCDHENAAYKKTCLIFTVLLEEEEEIPAKSHLSTVEEMVDDHLQKKFLSDSHPVSFDKMDLDKYGGLWSRISHLILPVTAEKIIELEGC